MRFGAMGAAFLALGVAMGAFGAHSLRGRLDEPMMAVYEKAVLYQFFHALGLLVTPLYARAGMMSEKAAQRVAILLIAGIVLFSGSLYALALTGVRTLGAVTPLGGVSFILAWALLAYELGRGKR